MSRVRDRHGRGLRGTVAPRSVPIARSAGQRFDDALLDVVEHLEAHGLGELAGIEIAVEDVPDIPGEADYTADVLADDGVPLARTLAPSAESDNKPLIVLYRRPLEARALDPEDLEDLLHEAVIDRLAHLLGRDPEDLDPHS